MLNDVSDCNLLWLEKELREKLNMETLIEESMLNQKAKEKQLNLGDSNSRYFYSLFKSNTKKQCINSIVNTNGIELFSKAEIEDCIVTHFQSIMSHSNSLPREVQDLSHFNVTGNLSSEEVVWLASQVTDLEIVKEVKMANSRKSLGPDGFNAHFYKIYWPIIGANISKAVKDFFSKGSLLKQVKNTFITLIP